jgi:catechol 2,3-dioxygenase-like lactoylglutathione lyase family enzyme
MPRVRVHHLAFRTKQLPTVVWFYRVVVGLALVRRHELPSGKLRSVWLDAGGTMLMIERADTTEPDTPSGSLELVAFKVAKRDLAKARRRLVHHCVHIESETAHTAYFRDPDGRRIAITTYPWPRLTGPE